MPIPSAGMLLVPPLGLLWCVADQLSPAASARFVFGGRWDWKSAFQVPVLAETPGAGEGRMGSVCPANSCACVVRLSRCRGSSHVLHLQLKFRLLASPLPFLAAFRVLDFVPVPVPRSQVGQSRFQGLSKATPSRLLPAWCPEHISLLVLFNLFPRSVWPKASLAAKCSCALGSLGRFRTLMLSAVSLQPLSQPCMVWGRWVSCF